MHTPLIFGEVLFDHFPDGSRVLGGAPFNVAWHLRGLGNDPILVSRIGTDPNGTALRQHMHTWGLRDHGLQTDPEHPTGTVQVRLEDGEPHYDILPDQAYDHTDANALPTDPGIGLIYHGTLGIRHPDAANALATLKQRHPEAAIFLDINLRPPWWQADQLEQLLHDATWLKVNENELDHLVPEEKRAAMKGRDLLRRYNLQGVIITLGERGAAAIDQDSTWHSSTLTEPVPVVDAVGAGDAFASVVIHGLMRGWPLNYHLLAKAQELALQIIGQRGATCDDRTVYDQLNTRWSPTRP